MKTIKVKRQKCIPLYRKQICAEDLQSGVHLSDIVLYLEALKACHFYAHLQN
jgi:hypothetical protein